MIPEPIAATQEIEKIARNILVGARAWGKFPTPVDKVIAYADLSHAKGVDLSSAPGIFASTMDFVGRISRKVLGILDYREKSIYLDETQKESRKNFVKLHEVGHYVLPWQEGVLGRKDDETTIDPEFDELCEREASSFASAGLFQLERFEEEAAKLPLALTSGRHLGKHFGGSAHAALRRYVERSPKRCALLVFHKPQTNGSFCAKVRNYFESPSFTEAFGGLVWPSVCGMEYAFVKEMSYGRKHHENGQIAVTTRTLDLVTLQYHFWDNSYNTFIFFIPPGEINKSRVKIHVRQ